MFCLHIVILVLDLRFTLNIIKYENLIFVSLLNSSHNFYEEFKMGVNTSCTGISVTYELGSYSEAEWFTITSGSTEYTFINIF